MSSKGQKLNLPGAIIGGLIGYSLGSHYGSMLSSKEVQTTGSVGSAQSWNEDLTNILQPRTSITSEPPSGGSSSGWSTTGTILTALAALALAGLGMKYGKRVKSWLPQILNRIRRTKIETGGAAAEQPIKARVIHLGLRQKLPGESRKLLQAEEISGPRIPPPGSSDIPPSIGPSVPPPSSSGAISNSPSTPPSSNLVPFNYPTTSPTSSGTSVNVTRTVGQKSKFSDTASTEKPAISDFEVFGFDPSYVRATKVQLIRAPLKKDGVYLPAYADNWDAIILTPEQAKRLPVSFKRISKTVAEDVSDHVSRINIDPAGEMPIYSLPIQYIGWQPIFRDVNASHFYYHFLTYDHILLKTRAIQYLKTKNFVPVYSVTVPRQKSLKFHKSPEDQFNFVSCKFRLTKQQIPWLPGDEFDVDIRLPVLVKHLESATKQLQSLGDEAYASILKATPEYLRRYGKQKVDE